MRIFVMGDIHGGHKALLQCLERSGFNKEEDTLIQLGDVCDGWSGVYECVEELLTIPNLISIKGNHDDWFFDWINGNEHGSKWQQGAFSTLKSYGFNCLGQGWEDFQVTWTMSDGAITNLLPEHVPPTHINFFRKQLPYYIKDNVCFVHGGFNRHQEFEGQQPQWIYWWDRDLWLSALSYKAMTRVKDVEYDGKFGMKTPFKEVFIGHTATVNWNKTTPMHAANIWNIDTGGGFAGKLTIMNVDTKEYFQSDNVQELYPNERINRK